MDEQTNRRTTGLMCDVSPWREAVCGQSAASTQETSSCRWTSGFILMFSSELIIIVIFVFNSFMETRGADDIWLIKVRPRLFYASFSFNMAQIHRWSSSSANSDYYWLLSRWFTCSSEICLYDELFIEIWHFLEPLQSHLFRLLTCYNYYNSNIDSKCACRSFTSADILSTYWGVIV